jgi:hypothetical protein
MSEWLLFLADADRSSSLDATTTTPVEWDAILLLVFFFLFKRLSFHYDVA